MLHYPIYPTTGGLFLSHCMEMAGTRNWMIIFCPSGSVQHGPFAEHAAWFVSMLHLKKVDMIYVFESSYYVPKIDNDWANAKTLFRVITWGIYEV